MLKPAVILSLAFVASAISCDSATNATQGEATADCPIGTFKPEGWPDCVFPAQDTFGSVFGVADNRCAINQPAYPPSCVSDTGRRAYFSLSAPCAPNYHFDPGVCVRSGGTGGTTGTGGFFTGFGGDTSVGFAGSGGSTDDFGTGGVPEVVCATTGTGGRTFATGTDCAGMGGDPTSGGGVTGNSGGGDTGSGGNAGSGGVTGSGGTGNATGGPAGT
ncbi:MAG TPA: hypothetical protein VHJ20_13620 [Polyangia bacterium]|nr:hypothetical protein [Polyangia bacterium]